MKALKHAFKRKEQIKKLLEIENKYIESFYEKYVEIANKYKYLFIVYSIDEFAVFLIENEDHHINSVRYLNGEIHRVGLNINKDMLAELNNIDKGA